MKYKFSVVMPVYNVEKYIEEAIESILTQTIGFEENIQLILVNDASSDKSGEICKEYAEKYPNNIVYVEQENQGVSVARNNGMKYIEGEIVNFLDSDDKWSKNAFELAEKFFEKNDVNILACRMKYFDRVTGFLHSSDYKFKKNRIVDITKDYIYPQLNGATSVFYRHEVIAKQNFEPRLLRSQDCFFFNKTMVDEKRFGLSKDVVHLYRQRSDRSSAVDNKFNDKCWVYTVPKYNYLKLFELSKKRYGRVLPYFQFLIMYDMRGRLKELPSRILNDEEMKTYLGYIKKILSEIDPKYILEMVGLGFPYKMYALKVRNNYKEKFLIKDGNLYYGDTLVLNNNRGEFFKLTKIEYKNKALYVEIESSIEQITDLKLLIKCGEKTISPEKKETKKTIKGIDGQTISRTEVFSASIPINKCSSISFVLSDKDQQYVTLNPYLDTTTGLSHNIPNSYKIMKEYIVLKRDKLLLIQKNTLKNNLYAKARRIASVSKRKLKKIKSFGILLNEIKA